MSYLKDFRLKPWKDACDSSGDLAPSEYDAARGSMIETQIHRRGVHDAAVLAAMSSVPPAIGVGVAVSATLLAYAGLFLRTRRSSEQPRTAS